MGETSRRTVLALGASTAALALLGAGDGKGKSPFAKKETPLKIDETIGDLSYVRSVGDVAVEGVGLVVNLNGTGSEPEQSSYRERLLSEMRAARVERPERVLAGRDKSLVIVRARIPVGVTKLDVFDVDIELTANSATTSLEGGQLLLTKLNQVAYVNGTPREGQALALAGGPVVTGTSQKPEDLKVGRVLGGARVKRDQPYLLVIRENRKSVRTAALIQKVIAARFFHLEGIEQKGMAEAKNDEILELRVPKTYHQNQARYFQVVQLLPLVDVPELRAKRVEQWSKELLDPKTAGVAALRLEGVGRNATEPLKQGLASTDSSVRFFAAESLAYLNDSSGVEVLYETTLKNPEFRAFALAALSATDQAASVSRLRNLLAHPEVEVRYGAFNALRSQDENDVYLGKTRVIMDEPAAFDADEQDAMAFQITAARARSRRMRDPFSLYLVDCEGPPMIHVSNTRRSEIVVFGRSQKLLPPLVLGEPNSVLINAGASDREAQISRFGGNGQGNFENKVSSPLEVGSVIQQVASMGVTYPQIISLLRMAEKQKNLEGPLTMDALPSPNDAYEASQLAGGKTEAKKDEALRRTGAGGKAGRSGLLDRLRPKAKKP